jgi:hypothetical protein
MSNEDTAATADAIMIALAILAAIFVAWLIL